LAGEFCRTEGRASHIHVPFPSKLNQEGSFTGRKLLVNRCVYIWCAECYLLLSIGTKERPVPKKPSEPQGATQMVRLNLRLWERMKTFGALKGRPPRQEIELRLNHSLAGGGEARGLSWGTAMGRLVGM